MEEGVELNFIAPIITPDHPEYWDIKKRCSRCRKFYTERENEKTGCWYHPGKFKSPAHAVDGISVGWSCCRSNVEESWIKSSDGEAFFHAGAVAH